MIFLARVTPLGKKVVEELLGDWYRGRVSGVLWRRARPALGKSERFQFQHAVLDVPLHVPDALFECVQGERLVGMLVKKAEQAGAQGGFDERMKTRPDVGLCWVLGRYLARAQMNS